MLQCGPNVWQGQVSSICPRILSACNLVVWSDQNNAGWKTYCFLSSHLDRQISSWKQAHWQQQWKRSKFRCWLNYLWSTKELLATWCFLFLGGLEGFMIWVVSIAEDLGDINIIKYSQNIHHHFIIFGYVVASALKKCSTSFFPLYFLKWSSVKWI